MFSMGRDQRLLFGKAWGTINTSLRTLIWAALGVMVLSIIPFLYSSAIGVLVTGATGLIYLSYFVSDPTPVCNTFLSWMLRSVP